MRATRNHLAWIVAEQSFRAFRLADDSPSTQLPGLKP